MREREKSAVNVIFCRRFSAFYFSKKILVQKNIEEKKNHTHKQRRKFGDCRSEW